MNLWFLFSLSVVYYRRSIFFQKVSIILWKNRQNYTMITECCMKSILKMQTIRKTLYPYLQYRPGTLVFPSLQLRQLQRDFQFLLTLGSQHELYPVWFRQKGTISFPQLPSIDSTIQQYYYTRQIPSPGRFLVPLPNPQYSVPRFLRAVYCTPNGKKNISLILYLKVIL